MDRNYLIGSHGDAANAALAAVGYNLRRLTNWLRELLCALGLVLSVVRQNPAPGPASADCMTATNFADD